jgi:hypothetical protein
MPTGRAERDNKMELNIIDVNHYKIAEIVSDDIVISTLQDALDVMADAFAQGAYRIVAYERNMAPAFFDLRTGLAGEVLQKHANYGVKIAIVGDFGKFNSRSLQAFILESNQGQLVFFMPDREAAIARLIR